MPEVYAGWRRVCSYFFCTKNRPPLCLFLDFCTHRVWYKPEIFVFGSCHVAVHLISSNVSDLGKSDVGYLQFPFVQKDLTPRKKTAGPAVIPRRLLDFCDVLREVTKWLFGEPGVRAKCRRPLPDGWSCSDQVALPRMGLHPGHCYFRELPGWITEGAPFPRGAPWFCHRGSPVRRGGGKRPVTEGN